VTIDAAKADPTLLSSLQERLGSEVFAAYAESLKSRYKVKVDQAKIDAFFANAAKSPDGATDEEAPE